MGAFFLPTLRVAGRPWLYIGASFSARLRLFFLPVRWDLRYHLSPGQCQNRSVSLYCLGRADPWLFFSPLPSLSFFFLFPPSRFRLVSKYHTLFHFLFSKKHANITNFSALWAKDEILENHLKKLNHHHTQSTRSSLNCSMIPL